MTSSLHLALALLAFIAAALIPLPPRPFADRLAPLQESETTIDNAQYNAHDYDWTPLSKLHDIRATQFSKIIKAQNLKILDFGCGDGKLTEKLADLMGDTSTIIGIDPSKNAIKRAQETKSSTQFQHMGDTTKIPFPDHTFDIVIAADVLEHIHDLHTVIKEIKRVLKRDGSIIFDTINRTYFSFVMTIWLAQDIFKYVPADAHDWRMYISPNEMQALLGEHGFRMRGEALGIQPSFAWANVFRFRPIAQWISEWHVADHTLANYIWAASISA